MADKSQAFEFISVSGKNIKGDAVTRKRVRSRAQADYRRKNPPPPRLALTHELDVGEWLQVVSRDAKKVGSGQLISQRAGRQRPTCDGVASPRPPPFDHGGADIFQLMGPEERKRAQVLWQHLYGGTCVVFKSMVEIGFLHLLRGSAALTQMLSTSAWHMNNEAGGAPSSAVEHARYSVMATRSLCHMLSEPSKRVTIETIVAILTFAAYANLTSDPELVNIHLDGLCHSLSYVGGLQAIDNLPVLRTMIFWFVTEEGLQDTWVHQV
ncbi:hypothetical protein ISF_08046 [Cordyceps fumosorosea ARSEF 2679]|uniref:Tachykinin family protein n=1 Tax=Cordyceps fumosorosea (strain ARSEF 2679) TaxID=1081104 RepID=A0A162ICE9_CORFA|nr:hypothetical protein ISF_08046 [Cordyceps fumosorosea ARSEF 2679]OAA55125.1 hypothetical protein ISF_08046 [Cordyceps fumosorosea ARSEF 2679]